MAHHCKNYIGTQCLHTLQSQIVVNYLTMLGKYSTMFAFNHSMSLSLSGSPPPRKPLEPKPHPNRMWPRKMLLLPRCLVQLSRSYPTASSQRSRLAPLQR